MFGIVGGPSFPLEESTGGAFYSKQSNIILRANCPVLDACRSWLFLAAVNSVNAVSEASKEAICRSFGPGIDSCSWMKKLIRHWLVYYLLTL